MTSERCRFHLAGFWSAPAERRTAVPRGDGAFFSASVSFPIHAKAASCFACRRTTKWRQQTPQEECRLVSAMSPFMNSPG